MKLMEMALTATAFYIGWRMSAVIIKAVAPKPTTTGAA